MQLIFKEHLETINALQSQIPLIEDCIEKIIAAVQANRKILLCGNGGSAADAQHIAAELSGKFYKHRAPINAEALHVNASYVTAVANDLGYDKIYCRAVRAKGQKGDVLIALSTSGNSKNVIEAVKKAKEMEILVIALSGNDGGALKELADISICVPSDDTPRIQEAHILIGHIICQKAEERLFPE